MTHKTGRPRAYTAQDEPLGAISARVTAWHKRWAKRFGNGNASDGIRYAIEVAAKAINEPTDNPERNENQ